MHSLKLNSQERMSLSKKEMNLLNGGNWICTCSCYYAGNGGSSIDDNMSANAVNTDPDKNQSKNGDNSHAVVVCTSTTKDPTQP